VKRLFPTADENFRVLTSTFLILLPSEIRKAEKLKEGDEFAVDSLGGGVFIIKKIDLRSLLKEAIEKAKGIDHEKVEREIEEESNQLAKKRFEVCP